MNDDIPAGLTPEETPAQRGKRTAALKRQLEALRIEAKAVELKPALNAFLWKHLPGTMTLSVVDAMSCEIHDLITDYLEDHKP